MRLRSVDTEDRFDPQFLQALKGLFTRRFTADQYGHKHTLD